jgi:hypothetical protein
MRVDRPATNAKALRWSFILRIPLRQVVERLLSLTRFTGFVGDNTSEKK